MEETDFGKIRPEAIRSGESRTEGRDEKWQDPSFSNETPYETRFFSVEYKPLEGDQYTAYTGRDCIGIGT